jgi:hypothetical protein
VVSATNPHGYILNFPGWSTRVHYIKEEKKRSGWNLGACVAHKPFSQDFALNNEQSVHMNFEPVNISFI